MSDSKHPKGLGSGHNGQLLDAVCCANWGSSERKERRCSQVGSKFCQNCRLVGYCSKECQIEHWKLHKVACKSYLMEEWWAPSWMREMRRPTWMSDVKLVAAQCRPEYLWGNVPAYGVLGSAASSSTLPKVLRVCFAASGDLRNVIETVCQLPDDFKGKATIYVNDADPKVVVRNYLMLELLRVHGREAIDAVIALWYSLAMTASQLKAAKGAARQLVHSWDMERCASGSTDADMESTMHFSHSSSFGSSGRGCLVAKFGEEAMDFMGFLCENKLSLVSATEKRKVVMESRPDLVDRRMGSLRPAHRVAWHHFRQTGVLLPFSADHHHHHNKANRFLLCPYLGWTVGDGSDPLDGWDIKQVIATGVQHGVPVMDLYGCLFFHLRSKLQSFLHQWQLGHVSLVLTNRDASDLAAELRSSKLTFHRIDTSNIADAHHAGIKKVLKDWGPLMSRCPKPSSNSSNSSACEPILITYFMNWALHYSKMKFLIMFFTHLEEPLLEPAMTAAEIKKAFEKAKHWGSTRKGFEEIVRQAMKHGDTCWYMYFHDFSHAFNEYLDMQGAFEAAREVGLSRKEKHAVVPHRLFVPVHSASNATPALFGNVNDFYSCIALQYNHTMTEKYVEWRSSWI